MSRCFPFPPPGYENKPRNHHVDLLAKEKHKEKKHKKEKRDREKRESKEGKGKDRNKERHQEKKDRKEKHKDKKRVKDRISDDGRIGGQTQGHNEQKLGVNNWKADEIKDSEFAEELDWRIQEEKGAAYRMFENFTGSIQSRVEDLEPSTAIKKERTKGNKMAAVVSSAKQSSNNGLGQPVENHVDKEIGKEKAKDEETDDRKDHRYKDRDSEEKRNKGKDSAKQSSNNGLGQPIENHVDKKIGKEKAKDEETDDRKDHSYKDRDSQEKRNKGKDSDRHKEKEKEKEKVSRKGDTKHKENNTSKESGKKDMVDSSNFKPLAPHKDDVKFIGDGNINKKRKDYEMNGFLHESDVRPNKFPRLVSSSHPPVENGRTIESCHIAAAHSSIGHGAKNNSKAERGLDNKGHKINGTPGAQPTSIDLRPAVNTRQNGGAQLKPPHPDFKYLSQIYRIPKLEEWPESDDQEWLFGGHNARPNLKASFEADEIPLVWAKVLQIESADVVALPYVIPY